ncbi:MAG TPA: response regulator transcription factor [Actinomycetota bacterium]|nr:response regulator transcription factor [Actinomycetota bacterium]
MTHVLLIEDDSRIRSIVEQGLQARGFLVSAAPDGEAGLALVRSLDVEVVLLDLILPGIGGLEVLAQIRTINPRLPVILVTALDDTSSKVDGLDAGADDYITKPFSVEELAARIRARLRILAEESTTLRAGALQVDLAAHRALLYGREVLLSARELTLLANLVRHQGEVLSRRKLLQLVWKVDFDPGSNVVEVYIAALRRKIGPEFIETVRGLGYRFVVPEEPSGEGRAQAGSGGGAASGGGAPGRPVGRPTPVP